MKNIEIKTRLDDRSRVERQLRALGARGMWCRLQRDTFFTVPRLGQMTGWLKLREADDSPPELIAYRRSPPDRGPHASDYDVVVVSDAETWKRLLTRVLPIDRVVEKLRTLWLYENTRIHLDRVEGLGQFLELETVVRGPDVEAAHAETRRLMAVLHIREEDCIRGTYRDLLAAEDG